MLCEPVWFGVSCLGVFYDFVNTTRYPDCEHAFDADIAGNGVVFSFVISVLITTLAAVCATTIDHFTGSEHTLLPRALRRKPSVPAEHPGHKQITLWRKVLDRLVLSFADQQLVTGFALLIGSWIKLSRPSESFGKAYNKQRQDLPLEWPYLWLPSSGFSLVVFLCCGSSSAHLACLLVLREYFTEHKITARVRMGLFIMFSMFLTATIALASSFTAHFIAIVLFIWGFNRRNPPDWAIRMALVFIVLLPVLAMLWMFWLCSLQLLPNRRRSLKTWLSSRIVDPTRKRVGLNYMWHKTTSWLQETSRDRLAKCIKAAFWTPILGEPVLVFMIQIVLASLSVAWTLLQRFAPPPAPDDYKAYMDDDSTLCALRHAATKYDVWSIGQTLPMFLLALPVLSAFETYIEERDMIRNRSELRQRSLQPDFADDDHELSLLSRRSSYSHNRIDSEGLLLPSVAACSPRPNSYGSPDVSDGDFPMQTSTGQGFSRVLQRGTYHRVPSETQISGSRQ